MQTHMSEHQYSAGIGDLKRASFRHAAEWDMTPEKAVAARRILFRTVAAIGVSALVTWVSLNAILSHVSHTVPVRH